MRGLSNSENYSGGQFAGEMAAFSNRIQQTIQKITSLIQMKKQIEDQEKELRQQLQAAMEEHGVKKWGNENISFTYIEPSTRTTIDSSMLKQLYPDIALKCSKISPVAATVRVVLKGSKG